MDERINKITNNEKIERFFINPKEFDIISQPEKIKINKSELSKAINVSSESGEPEFAFIPQVYDNKKLEESTVSESSLWMKKVQKDLEKELKEFYGD